MKMNNELLRVKLVQTWDKLGRPERINFSELRAECDLKVSISNHSISTMIGTIKRLPLSGVDWWIKTYCDLTVAMSDTTISMTAALMDGINLISERSGCDDIDWDTTYIALRNYVQEKSKKIHTAFTIQ